MVDEPHETTHHLNTSLNKFLKNQGFQGVSTLASISAVWSEVVGELLAQHATPGSIHDGELTVIVDHPAWATEVRFHAQHILAALAERVEKSTIVSLKAHVQG